MSWYKTDTGYSVEDAVIGPRLRPLADYKSPKAAIPRARRERERWKQENHTLVRFADRLLQRFEEGRLFSWLREFWLKTALLLGRVLSGETTRMHTLSKAMVVASKPSRRRRL